MWRNIPQLIGLNVKRSVTWLGLLKEKILQKDRSKDKQMLTTVQKNSVYKLRNNFRIIFLSIKLWIPWTFHQQEHLMLARKFRHSGEISVRLGHSWKSVLNVCDLQVLRQHEEQSGTAVWEQSDDSVKVSSKSDAVRLSKFVMWRFRDHQHNQTLFKGCHDGDVSRTFRKQCVCGSSLVSQLPSSLLVSPAGDHRS